MFSRLRERLERWRVKRRRQKLLSAYAKVARVRYDLGPGFSPMLFALDRITSEGLAILVDGELRWVWPNDTLDEATGLHTDEDVVDAVLVALAVGGEDEDYILGRRAGAREVARELGVASPEFWKEENYGPTGEEEFWAKWGSDSRAGDA